MKFIIGSFFGIENCAEDGCLVTGDDSFEPKTVREEEIVGGPEKETYQAQERRE